MGTTERLEVLATFLFMHYNDLPPQLNYWGLEEEQFGYGPKVWEKGFFHKIWLEEAKKVEEALFTSHSREHRFYCDSCGELNFAKTANVTTCKRCQNTKRQRKKNIRSSIKQGLSFDEILKKHNKMDSKEIIEYYNSITKEG